MKRLASCSDGTDEEVTMKKLHLSMERLCRKRPGYPELRNATIQSYSWVIFNASSLKITEIVSGLNILKSMHASLVTSVKRGWEWPFKLQ